MELPFKDNIYGILFCSWLGWASCLPARSLSSILRNPQSGEDRAGRGHLHTGGIRGDPEGEKRLEQAAGGWGTTRDFLPPLPRLVRIYRVEVGLSPVGTKPWGKLAAAVKGEKSAGTT